MPKTDLLLFEASTEDALRRLVSLRADVIIVDDSPKLGVKAMRAAIDAAPSVPVIALTAKGDAETVATYTMAGARECLEKRFQLDELKSAVDECLKDSSTVLSHIDV